MNFLIFALVLTASADVFQSHREEEMVFFEWANKHHIRMGRSDNLQERIKTFTNNLHDIENHNSKHLAYNLSLNEFSHLTIDELQQQKLGYVAPTKDTANRLPSPSSRGSRAVVPDSFDWRTRKGVVRPVQNQGSCGSCWAFAAIGAIEGQMSLWKYEDQKLSEQEIIDCVRDGGKLKGCGGGNDQGVYSHAAQGVATLSMNPYRAFATGSCNVGIKRAEGSYVKGFYQVPSNEKTVKEWLAIYGPLYTIFYVASDLYSYSGGVYTDAKNQCAGKSYNHAVLIVGYGTQNGIDYWLVKNSWGPSWGENGYFKIQRGKFLCNIARFCSFPALTA